jgi:hypothetical protein
MGVISRTVKCLLVFIAACSSAPREVAPPVPRPIDAAVLPDVAQPAPPPPPPAPGARGDACGPEHACAETLVCAPFPGGYCTSACGATGSACDAACIESAKAGELCMKACTNDSDCRREEGYVCDPQWHACSLPNFAAIVPKTCTGTGARDPAFAASEPWSTAAAPGVYQFEPSASLLSDGSVVAMYITRGSMFEGNVLGVSTTKVKDQSFKTDKQSAFDPWLARDASGAVHAVWYAFDGRDEHGAIEHATTKDGVTWSTPEVVHEPSDCTGEGECLDKPMIVAGRGVLYIMYSADDAGLRVRTLKGGKLGPPVTALSGIYGNAVVGRDGRLHIVTVNGGPLGGFGSADQKVEYTVSSDGGASFASPIRISRDGEMIPFFFANPSVAVDDARGWVYVAYVRGGRDAVWDIVVAASRDKGKTWKRTTISDGCAIHMVPNLAVDIRTGTLHLAYYDNEGAPRFAHATCTPGAAKCTVKGAINSLPFAALSTERHASKWIGEYESLLVDDRRHVLHAVWTQPVDEGGTIVSRIFHATAKL